MRNVLQYFPRVGKRPFTEERRRKDFWDEHNAHYEWILLEEKLIRDDWSRLTFQSQLLEQEDRRLSAWLNRNPEGTAVEIDAGDSESFLDRLQECCAAFEAAVNQYKSRLRRWREERDRFNAIDRIIERP